jgi:hypothetical protein
MILVPLPSSAAMGVMLLMVILAFVRVPSSRKRG